VTSDGEMKEGTICHIA